MTTELKSSPALAYALDIPDGWEGVERPGAEVELQLHALAIDGLATTLSVERFAVDEQTPADAVDRLLAGRIEGMLAAMADVLLIDVAEAPNPHGASRPGVRATVAYRHGPATITSLLWLFTTDAEALLLTAVVDTDLLEADLRVLEGIIATLDLAPGRMTVGQPPLEPGSAAHRAGPLPAAPDGWRDVDLGDDPRLRRQLVPDDASVQTVTVSAMVLPEADASPDADETHRASIVDLSQTLTDATVLGTEPSLLASEPALRSSIWFRTGAGDRVAELWTTGRVAAWSVTSSDDEPGRTRAATLLAEASLAELGCDDEEGAR